ncbi:hypothetical protein BDZ45DRAFT_685611 [Acephala macrosclerotiorum]|nr:hypothetical protein BDZ45DRAFT_685611 [Acephala macrosclerotiorum]
MTPTVIVSNFPDDPSRRQMFYTNPGLTHVEFDSNGRPSNPNWSWLPQLKSTFAPLRIFDIHKLPVEIRILIFRQCILEWEPSRFTPPLIKALRPEPSLYHEALDVYYSFKQCSTPRMGERAKGISPSVLRRACSLRVWYRPEYLDERQLHRRRMQCNLFDLLLPSTPSLRNHIHSLHMATDVINAPGTGAMQSLVVLVKRVIVYLPALRKLTIEIPITECKHGTWTATLICPTFSIDIATGIDHQWDMRMEDRQPWANLAVTWDARHHQTLTWTDCEYWHSILWRHIGLMFTVLTLSQKVGFFATTRHHPLGLGHLRNAPNQIYCGNPSCQSYIILAQESLIFNPCDWPNVRPWMKPDIMDPRLEESMRNYRVPAKFFVRKFRRRDY